MVSARAHVGGANLAKDEPRNRIVVEFLVCVGIAVDAPPCLRKTRPASARCRGGPWSQGKMGEEEEGEAGRKGEGEERAVTFEKLMSSASLLVNCSMGSVTEMLTMSPPLIPCMMFLPSERIGSFRGAWVGERKGRGREVD